MSIKEQKKRRKKKWPRIAVAAVVVISLTVGVIVKVRGNEEKETSAITKETKVERGNLTQGITESGSVEAGSVTQSFSLDWSSIGSGTTSTQSGTMEQTSGTEQTSLSNTSESGSSDAALVVKKVNISPGQVVKKGDALLQLTSNSVAEVKAVYDTAVETAELAWKNAKMERDSAVLTARYEYQERLARGKSAKTAYLAELESLQAAVTRARTAYQEAKNASQKEKQKSDYKANLSNLKLQLESAKKAQENGKITAKQTYEESKLSSKNAKALYEAAIDDADDSMETAAEERKEVKAARKKFLDYVGNGTIYAKYSGTVTSVGYQKGDRLSSSTEIATYMDEEAVALSVSVSQEDISRVSIGDTVNVSIAAYEDTVFHATVTSISTESTGSNSASYPVVVTLTGEVSGIYTGMSGEVTFVTDEVENVLYVSQKAITKDGDTSYVKKKDSAGNIVKTKVTTGFSDGHNVQIESGLEEGDTVLIESQVSQ